ncbi:hypothetical protein [Enterococcus faecalis]|uniref:hypothetical protein n=1 Tax=Enterococcus faecalis TaxID=1351 RepID=UPI0003313194|nr:hypothetical protein [Enterococcus faecalis]EOJ64959.1 hypothetical protein WMM_00402 [Enterococcus faecalis EnGen0364]
MEERVRFEARFLNDKNPFGLAYIEKYEMQYPGKKNAELLMIIFEEHSHMKEELENMKQLRESIIADIKKELDPIRIRTGYVDKNVRVLMDIENGRLIKEGISSLGGMNDLVAKPMKQSIQRVTDEIAAYRMKKVEREQKNTNIDPGGHE